MTPIPFFRLTPAAVVDVLFDTEKVSGVFVTLLFSVCDRNTGMFSFVLISMTVFRWHIYCLGDFCSGCWTFCSISTCLVHLSYHVSCVFTDAPFLRGIQSCEATDKLDTFVRVLLVDYNKALDQINHDLLIAKLCDMGLWGHGYPNGGVPQGTLSGPNNFLTCKHHAPCLKMLTRALYLMFVITLVWLCYNSLPIVKLTGLGTMTCVYGKGERLWSLQGGTKRSNKWISKV